MSQAALESVPASQVVEALGNGVCRTDSFLLTPSLVWADSANAKPGDAGTNETPRVSLVASGVQVPAKPIQQIRPVQEFIMGQPESPRNRVREADEGLVPRSPGETPGRPVPLIAKAGRWNLAESDAHQITQHGQHVRESLAHQDAKRARWHVDQLDRLLESLRFELATVEGVAHERAPQRTFSQLCPVEAHKHGGA